MQMPDQNNQTGGMLAITSGSPQRATQGTNIADARDYNELMDEYSLHQLIIRRGQILD